jgi:hypothetical protein
MQLAPVAQTFPHEPQLFTSEATATQVLLQTCAPVAQRQEPPLQTPPVGQAAPQAEQLLLSDVRSTQAVPQSDLVPGHLQLPETQLVAAAQMLWQEPQLFRSVRRFDSQPSFTLALQLSKPVAQEAMPQLPAVQDGVSWFVEQVTRQPPQFVTSVCVPVQTPLQASEPEGHVHWPPMQEPPVSQVVPQAPQFVASLVSSTQRPLHSDVP